MKIGGRRPDHVNAKAIRNTLSKRIGSTRYRDGVCGQRACSVGSQEHMTTEEGCVANHTAGFKLKVHAWPEDTHQQQICQALAAPIVRSKPYSTEH